MTTNAICICLEPNTVLHGLSTEAMEVIGGAAEELELDFSAIPRIDTAAAVALESLADAASQRRIRIRLRNANVNVYKALLLLGFVRRFTFVN